MKIFVMIMVMFAMGLMSSSSLAKTNNTVMNEAVDYCYGVSKDVEHIWHQYIYADIPFNHQIEDLRYGKGIDPNEVWWIHHSIKKYEELASRMTHKDEIATSMFLEALQQSVLAKCVGMKLYNRAKD